MPRYFVHRYDVVRVKVAVEAESQAEALIQADDYLAQHHPIANRYDDDWADRVLPTWVHYEEPGQEVTGYLVDEVGDENYENSLSYDANHKPIYQGI